jgi:hypothetical protein
VPNLELHSTAIDQQEPSSMLQPTNCIYDCCCHLLQLVNRFDNIFVKRLIVVAVALTADAIAAASRWKLAATFQALSLDRFLCDHLGIDTRLLPAHD